MNWGYRPRPPPFPTRIKSDEEWRAEGFTVETFEEAYLKDPAEHDTSHTRYITCPYCGYEDTDSWEWLGGNEGTEETECGDCEKKFLASRRQPSCYYDTEVLPEGQEVAK